MDHLKRNLVRIGRYHERFENRWAQSIRRILAYVLNCIIDTRRQRMAVGQLRTQRVGERATRPRAGMQLG